ncbi:hypothetical protein ACH5RR_026223 [Cinchona calisaya]|uniref:Uncharacterized protein n=1 Tax=Cinchona calisaya TaxID=153742 RepID=A0ABD2Z3W0_9GENT
MTLTPEDFTFSTDCQERRIAELQSIIASKSHARPAKPTFRARCWRTNHIGVDVVEDNLYSKFCPRTRLQSNKAVTTPKLANLEAVEVEFVENSTSGHVNAPTKGMIGAKRK